MASSRPFVTTQQLRHFWRPRTSTTDALALSREYESLRQDVEDLFSDTPCLVYNNGIYIQPAIMATGSDVVVAGHNVSGWGQVLLDGCILYQPLSRDTSVYIQLLDEVVGKDMWVTERDLIQTWDRPSTADRIIYIQPHVAAALNSGFVQASRESVAE